MAFCAPLDGLAADLPDFRIELLLNESMIQDHGQPAFVNAFDLTPERLLLLASSKQMYLLGWGGFVQVGPSMKSSVSCFAHTPDGLLMVVRGTKLAYINHEGDLIVLFELPSPNMGIAAGHDKMFLYEQRGSNGNGLFALFKGKQFTKILESPDPIEAVTEVGGRIVFATGKGVYAVAPGVQLEMLFAAPAAKRIRSIAVDSDGRLVYFSTDKGIYALRHKEVEIVTEALSGLLKWKDHALFVFDPEKKTLMRITGLSETINSDTTNSLAPVTK